MSSFVRHFYFSVRGRASRRFYWLFGVGVFLPVGLLFGVALRAALPRIPTMALLLLSLVFAILALWSSVAVHAKRLHDIGVSGWWIIAAWAISLSFLYFVSVRAGQLASLVIWVAVGAVPGMRGVNRFGPDPRRSHSQQLEQGDVPTA